MVIYISITWFFNQLNNIGITFTFCKDSGITWRKCYIILHYTNTTVRNCAMHVVMCLQWCVSLENALLCFRTLTPLWRRRIATVTVDCGDWRLSPSGQLLRKVLPILVRSRSRNITGLGRVTHIGGTAFRCGSIHLACIHTGALYINIYILSTSDVWTNPGLLNNCE